MGHPPIDYTPQYRGGLFRPKEVIEQELAALEEEGEPRAPEAPGPAWRPDERPDDRPPGRPATPQAAIPPGPASGQPSALSPQQLAIPTPHSPLPTPHSALRNPQSGAWADRLKVRHSFDIYQDQLLDLAEIQAEIFRRTGRKPKIGDLVQDAIDAYIRELRVKSEK